MKPSLLTPATHLFVCANRRDADSPLGAGCADAGERLFAELKSAVGRDRAYARVWVTKTACMGLCPRVGAAVASYRGGEQRLYTEVEHGDARALYEGETKEAS